MVKGLLVGPGAPLAPLMDCLRLLAAPMIPCMMLVLGAVLYKGPGSARLPARLIAGVVALRLLLMPLCGAPDSPHENPVRTGCMSSVSQAGAPVVVGSYANSVACGTKGDAFCNQATHFCSVGSCSQCGSCCVVHSASCGHSRVLMGSDSVPLTGASHGKHDICSSPCVEPCCTRIPCQELMRLCL